LAQLGAFEVATAIRGWLSLASLSSQPLGGSSFGTELNGAASRGLGCGSLY